MHIDIIRDAFSETSSAGKLFIDGQEFCYTLEDASRGYGVKVDGKTAVPTGQYNVTITPSARFKRPMPLLYTNRTTLACDRSGVVFTGIRIHGGNSAENTEGCILVARVRDSVDKIHDSMESTLTARIKAAMDAGQAVTLSIKHSAMLAGVA